MFRVSVTMVVPGLVELEAKVHVGLDRVMTPEGGQERVGWPGPWKSNMIEPEDCPERTVNRDCAILSGTNLLATTGMEKGGADFVKSAMAKAVIVALPLLGAGEGAVKVADRFPEAAWVDPLVDTQVSPVTVAKF